MRLFSIVLGFFGLLAVSACGQPPAQVVLKGQNDYTKHAAGYAPLPVTYTPYSSSNHYSIGADSGSSAALATETTARIEPISVRDLPPSAAAAPSAKPVHTEKSSASPVRRSGYGLAGQERRDAFLWPVPGRRVLSAYGPQGAGKANDGITIATAEGEPVRAAAGGEVVYATAGPKGYGPMVLIKHSGNRTTTYANLGKLAVEKYDRVQQGDVIGYAGAGDNAGNSRLYFAVREGKKPVNPRKYLASELASSI